jgi:endonuclease-3
MEPPVRLKARAKNIVKGLRKAYPEARTALRFSTPFELLIATILSAQCTDERVNKVTEQLFKEYRSPHDYLEVDPRELEQDIKQTGFYRNKAKSIRSCCKSLVERYNGEVPAELDELVTLGGVGRKTANLVLGCAFNKPAIIVDTHVKRVVGRLELSKETDPDKIEFGLQQVLDKNDWTQFSNALILHGRRVCQARRPLCEECVIRSYCPFPKKQKQ